MFTRSNAPARLLMLLLPLAVFTAVVLVHLNEREQKAIEEVLANTATATIAALDRQVGSEIAILTSLATHPSLDGGDTADFVERARRILPVHEGWYGIAVTGRDRLVANTWTGVQDQGRALVDPQAAEEVFRTAKPYVSGVLPPNGRNPEPYYVVRVPVIRDGAVRYTLTASIRAWTLHETINQLPVPDGGRIGFLDRDGRVLARSNSGDPGDGLIGNLPSRTVLDGAMRQSDGLFRATPLDSPSVYMVGRRHGPTGWTALISAPVAVLDAPRTRMLLMASGGAFLALALTVAVGIAMARATTRRIEAERRVAVLEAEAGRRQVEAVLAKVLEVLPVGVFMIDRDGVIATINAEARRIWAGGISVDVDRFREYKGWWRDSGRRIESREWAAARAILNGESILGEVVDIESFDGRRKTITVSSVPLTSDDGGINGAVTVIQDVTEQHRIERDLQRSNEAMRLAIAEADRANMAKSRFLAAASHDLRQPVQSLFFLLSALEDRVTPGAEKTLAHATEALTALKSLLDGLLDISRLDAGTIEPRVEEFPLAPLLDQIDAEYRPLAAAKGLDWHVVETTATVRSDPALLGRMLRNLCQNAIRYTETGSVLVRCRVAGDRLRIAVEDTGIGIPPEKLGDIFEEFQQLGNANRDRSQGLGLGLAIVRRISTLLGHAVDVRSTPGEGSAFSVLVPMTVAPTPRRPEAEVIRIAQGSGKRVVVIDDEELVRFGVRALIESWGYTVVDAASGPDAAEALRNGRRMPDLIVSDYRLSEGRNGIDAIRSLRALTGRPVPAILLTGETTRSCATDAAKDDIVVLHKPITPAQLHAALTQMTIGDAGVEAQVPVTEPDEPWRQLPDEPA